MTARERILAPFWAVRLAFCRAICRRRGHVPFTYRPFAEEAMPNDLTWCRRCGQLSDRW